MIKMTRIDYRLLHGQVAFAWTKNLSANAILIANDDVVNDSFRKQTLNLAKPNDTKLIFKSIEDSTIYLNTDFFRVCRVEVVDGYAHLEIINRNGEEEIFDDIEYSGDFKNYVEGL